jgi:hypothetical protein
MVPGFMQQFTCRPRRGFCVWPPRRESTFESARVTMQQFYILTKTIYLKLIARPLRTRPLPVGAIFVYAGVHLPTAEAATLAAYPDCLQLYGFR